METFSATFGVSTLKLLLPQTDETIEFSVHTKNVTSSMRPPYKTMNKDISRYIEAQFLPTPDSLPPGITFILEKPYTMDKEVLKIWIKILIARQNLRDQGENIVVFAFIPQEKKSSPPESGPTSKKLRSKKSAAKSKGKKPRVAASDANASDEEEEIKRGLQWIETENETDSEDDEDTGEGSDGDDTGSKSSTSDADDLLIVIEDLSPASVDADWISRLSFLRSLSNLAVYGRLVSWLERNQVKVACLVDMGLTDAIY